MILEYKQFRAKIYYAANTRSYYGEIIIGESVISFQVSERVEVEQTMRLAVDQFLAQTEDCVLN